MNHALALPIATVAILLSSQAMAFHEPARTLEIWPGGQAPGDPEGFGPEQETTKPTDRLVAGKPVSRITGITRPSLAVYPAPNAQPGGPAVIICPGGGHRILAYDLEGTEVAEWLNSIGITALVLKYRVPARPGPDRWLSAVQDAQRAVSVVRSRASELGIDPDRIGLLGFSAGGQTAALASILEKRRYEPLDAADQVSSRPNFAVLVYSGGLIEESSQALLDIARPTPGTPPMFLAHAADDPVPATNSTALAHALSVAKIPVELHLYATGGHGFGLRRTDSPSTTWPDRCAEWLKTVTAPKPTP